MVNRIILIYCLIFVCVLACYSKELPQIVVDSEKVYFINKESKQLFIPYMVNHDLDSDFKLIEQFWIDKKKIEKAFSEIKFMGFNVVHIHVQQFVLQKGKNEFDNKELSNLDTLIKTASVNDLYIDITGLDDIMV